MHPHDPSAAAAEGALKGVQGEHELSKLGYMATPEIDGEVIVGFDRKRLDALLGSA